MAQSTVKRRTRSNTSKGSQQSKGSQKNKSNNVLEWADGDTNMFVNALCVGPSKTGKTTFACSFPKPVIINLDKGLATIRNNHSPYFTIHRMSDEDLEVGNLCSADDVLDIIMNLKMRKGPYWDMLEKAKYVPETLVIDSLSALSDVMEAEILYKNVPTEKGMKRKGGLFMGDYNIINNGMLRVIGKAKELTMHLVCTAGIQAVHDETNRRFEAPMVSGQKLGPRIPHEFDDVYLHYYDTQKKKWYLSPEQTRSFTFSGTRFKIPMEPVENPTFKKMEKYYKVK